MSRRREALEIQRVLDLSRREASLRDSDSTFRGASTTAAIGASDSPASVAGPLDPSSGQVTYTTMATTPSLAPGSSSVYPNADAGPITPTSPIRRLREAGKGVHEASSLKRKPKGKAGAVADSEDEGDLTGKRPEVVEETQLVAGPGVVTAQRRAERRGESSK